MKKTDILIFEIGSLMEKPTGERALYSFGGDVELEGIDFAEPIKGRIEIMRIDGGFNVQLMDIFAKVNFKCEKCVNGYQQEVQIKSSDWHFNIEPIKKAFDAQDNFQIDKKHLTLDISDALRQEIILHFPQNLVCSDSCKGLCFSCGKDLNKEKCSCKKSKKQETTTDFKPLSQLKELFKK